MTNLQKQGAALAAEILGDLRDAGDSVEVTPCLDRCQGCERSFVAAVDGAPVGYPTGREFLSDLRALRAE